LGWRPAFFKTVEPHSNTAKQLPSPLKTHIYLPLSKELSCNHQVSQYKIMTNSLDQLKATGTVNATLLPRHPTTGAGGEIAPED
jgi:hypothetical protein